MDKREETLWWLTGRVRNFSALPATVKAELRELPAHVLPSEYATARTAGCSVEEALKLASMQAEALLKRFK